MPSAELLLGYQQRILQAMVEHKVTVVEKSRRIGATWSTAAGAVLTAMADTAAGGMDVFYIGYNREMTREFVDTAAMWARAFAGVAVRVEEFVFRDQHGDDVREIQAFRINFASGYSIVALPSRPRSLRGRQGYVILDEAAFHEELQELLKAAFALLMWGGRVLLISTHNGADNPFNELIGEIRAGKKPYHIERITFADALVDGLYKRICEVSGKEWSPDAEAAWEKEIRDIYGDHAGEELDCIPVASGGKYFSRVLLESASRHAPVLTWACADEFVDLGDHQRRAECGQWIKEQLDPLLDAMSGGQSFVGGDFARSADLTVLWPLRLVGGLVRETPFTVELRNVPFTEQLQIAVHLCSSLPGFAGGAFDARSNGQWLAERLRQTYGPQCIAEVQLTEAFYGQWFPRLKSNLEDGKFTLPGSPQLLDDFRTVETVRGVPRIVERTGGKGTKRHGDSAVAAMLANYASVELDAGPLEWFSAMAPPQAFENNALGTGLGGLDDYQL
jgi:phage FluMu gp28-like protein